MSDWLPKDYKYAHFVSDLFPIRSVFKSFEKEVNELDEWGRKAEKENAPWFDWENVHEICEELYGGTFVIARSFLRRELGQLAKKSKAIATTEVRNYLRNFSPPVGKTGIRRLELVGALANCYKHSGEWEKKMQAGVGIRWQAHGKNRGTFALLEQVGVEDVFFPCVRGVHIYTSGQSNDFFRILYNDLVNWGRELIKLDGGKYNLGSWIVY